MAMSRGMVRGRYRASLWWMRSRRTAHSKQVLQAEEAWSMTSSEFIAVMVLRMAVMAPRVVMLLVVVH